MWIEAWHVRRGKWDAKMGTKGSNFPPWVLPGRKTQMRISCFHKRGGRCCASRWEKSVEETRGQDWNFKSESVPLKTARRGGEKKPGKVSIPRSLFRRLTSSCYIVVRCFSQQKQWGIHWLIHAKMDHISLPNDKDPPLEEKTYNDDLVKRMRSNGRDCGGCVALKIQSPVRVMQSIPRQLDAQKSALTGRDAAGSRQTQKSRVIFFQKLMRVDR